MATLTGSNVVFGEAYGAWTDGTNANGAADAALAVSPSNVSDSIETVTWDINGSVISQLAGTSLVIRGKYAAATGIGGIQSVQLMSAVGGGGSTLEEDASGYVFVTSLGDVTIVLSGATLADWQATRSVVANVYDTQAAGDVTISIDSLTITYTAAESGDSGRASQPNDSAGVLDTSKVSKTTDVSVADIPMYVAVGPSSFPRKREDEP